MAEEVKVAADCELVDVVRDVVHRYYYRGNTSCPCLSDYAKRCSVRSMLVN